MKNFQLAELTQNVPQIGVKGTIVGLAVVTVDRTTFESLVPGKAQPIVELPKAQKATKKTSKA